MEVNFGRKLTRAEQQQTKRDWYALTPEEQAQVDKLARQQESFDKHSLGGE